MIRTAFDKTLGLLPPSWSAAIDLHFRPEIRWRWGGPMNGQDGRMAMVREVIDRTNVQQIVETGTCRGATTEWFANVFDGPILTVEFNRRFYLFAKSILAPYSNVSISEMDSRAWLRGLATDGEITSKTTLFYLDAHQASESQPVAEEIQIITKAWPSFSIVIDDVALPDDPGYDGEDLGNGLRLDLDYILKALPDGVQALTPALSSSHESGMRRGCCVVARSGAEFKTLSTLRSLRAL